MPRKTKPKSKALKEKALRVLDTLAAHESLQFGTDREKHEQPYAKFVSLVYRLAHAAADTGCKHPEWEKELKDYYKEFKAKEMV